jgi:hypothetical protein
MSQLDYPEVQLGNGRYTIGTSGCFLTSLAMASCMLHERTDLDPVRANDLVRANRGFSGSGLELSRAAPALGLRVTSRDISSTPDDALLQRLDASLAAGRPVVIAVDFQPGQSSGESPADHFLLAYARLGPDRWQAMDPAGGNPVVIRRDAATSTLRYEAAPDRVLTELIFLEKAPFARDPGPQA